MTNIFKPYIPKGDADLKDLSRRYIIHYHGMDHIFMNEEEWQNKLVELTTGDIEHIGIIEKNVFNHGWEVIYSTKRY